MKLTQQRNKRLHYLFLNEFFQNPVISICHPSNPSHRRDAIPSCEYRYLGTKTTPHFLSLAFLSSCRMLHRDVRWDEEYPNIAQGVLDLLGDLEKRLSVYLTRAERGIPSVWHFLPRNSIWLFLVGWWRRIRSRVERWSQLVARAVPSPLVLHQAFHWRLAYVKFTITLFLLTIVCRWRWERDCGNRTH